MLGYVTGFWLLPGGGETEAQTGAWLGRKGPLPGAGLAIMLLLKHKLRLFVTDWETRGFVLTTALPMTIQQRSSLLLRLVMKLQNQNKPIILIMYNFFEIFRQIAWHRQDYFEVKTNYIKVNTTIGISSVSLVVMYYRQTRRPILFELVVIKVLYLKIQRLHMSTQLYFKFLINFNLKF